MEPEEYENYIAALTLGKTIAFLLYSVLTILFLFGAFMLLGVQRLPRPYQDIIVVASFLALESILLWSVVRGSLPGTRAAVVQPISEKQIAVGCHLLSAGAWLLASKNPNAYIVQWVINGALVASGLIYFVTKSVLSKRPRWPVLSILVLPVLQFYYE